MTLWSKRALRGVGIIILTTSAAACAIPDVEETRAATVLTGRAAVQADELIAVVGDHDRSACVRTVLSNSKHKFRTIETKELRSALYPWFETKMPTTEDLAALLKRQLVRQRLEKMGVRYIVTVSGSLTGALIGPGRRQNVEGGIACGGGMGVGGCLGFEAWDRTSQISASVFDVKHRADVGSFGTKASGTSTMPAFILPIPLLSPTESTACTTLARRLARYFAGKPMNSPASK